MASHHLSDLLEQTAPADLVRVGKVEGAPAERVLILDGVDEVPETLKGRFVSDFDDTLKTGAYRHVLLTSRQAFYAANRKLFRTAPEAFYILGLGERDVRAFVDHHGGSFEAFMAEIQRLQLSTELGNPFALEVLYRTFTDTGTLGRLRSEPVEHVVESLIASRPNVAADRQRRALRMLAIAMETACRNELLANEAAKLLQAAMPVTAQQAEELLDELTHSILIRTPNGLSFQMRSFGEYLAALELRGMSLDRIQLLLNYEHTGIPNESWRNCVSYLVEIHPGVRRSFALKSPDWVMAASPYAFSDDERTTLVTRLLEQLASRGQYIRRH
ncbi:MAG: hypothetical protein IH986_06155, partial [Planctomycetes bacterium]|nr:hypothetical protein [Planctomycetota bacterium]